MKDIERRVCKMEQRKPSRGTRIVFLLSEPSDNGPVVTGAKRSSDSHSVKRLDDESEGEFIARAGSELFGDDGAIVVLPEKNKL